MAEDLTDWRSPTGVNNALSLRSQYREAFTAIAEFDRIGHALLFRAAQATTGENVEELVGLAMVRRAVTIFTGLRTLFESSLPDPARALARAYFELSLNYRCLAYGNRSAITLETPTSSAEREPRARRYYVAAERRGMHSRALILAPNATYPLQSEEDRPKLEGELAHEIERVRKDYPEEWKFFGDITPVTVLKHVGSRKEPPWFKAEWPDGSVTTVAGLAAAFGYKWEYDFLYDIFSALVHSRGIKQDITIEGDTVSVHHPHDPEWFQMLSYFISGWHLPLLMTAAKWNVPEMVPQLQQLYTRHRKDWEALHPEDPPRMLT